MPPNIFTTEIENCAPPRRLGSLPPFVNSTIVPSMSNRLDAQMKPKALLGPSDPPPFAVENRNADSNVLLVCDHGGFAVPAALDGLGLDPAYLARHIAHDIGAADVTRLLSARLNVPAIFFSYSRLVVDPNRWPDDPTVIREISDGTVIPGNRSLTAARHEERHEELHRPYHHAVTGMLDQVVARGATPAIVSIHSFTPIMKGFERPWHVGILTNIDRRMGDALTIILAEDPSICIGDNKPYSGLSPYGYTIETQAVPQGYPNVLLEIRQDLIDTHHGAAEWADRLGAALERVYLDRELFTPFQG